LAWTESLSVGNPTLDDHHRHLFTLLDRVAGVGAGPDLGAVRAVFDDLADYIGYHFSEEEAMMAEAGFPFLELHRHSHKTIALRVADMAASLAPDNVERVAGELYAFLTGWLVHHIEIEDFEYRPFLTAGG
jgi:hemerythrin